MEVHNGMQLAQESIQWHALLDIKFNHKVMQKMQNFFTCVTINFSVLTLPYRVSYM